MGTKIKSRPRAALVRVVLAVALGLITLGSYSGAAGADEGRTRCRLERVVMLDGQPVLLADVATIAGAARPAPPPAAFSVFVNGQALGSATQVGARGDELTTHVVIALQLSRALVSALPALRQSLLTLLRELPPRSSVAVLRFGGEVLRPPALTTPARAIAELPELEAEDEAVVQLGKGLQRGAELLQKAASAARRPSRQILIVVSNGENSVLERNYFRALGDELQSAGITVFPIGLSPQQPGVENLLHLGELAKRTGGTFRWARDATELTAATADLTRQLRSTLVVEFGDEATRRALRGWHQAQDGLWLQCGGVKSNTLGQTGLKGSPQSPWTPPATSGVWPVIVLVLAGLTALALLWGWLAARRRPDSALVNAPRPTVPARAQGPWLEPLSGILGGQPIALTGSLVLGSATAAGVLRLSGDGAVSARHCTVALTREGLVLTDLGSTNGTRLNEQRITKPTRLKTGDIIALGNLTRFRVQGIP